MRDARSREFVYISAMKVGSGKVARSDNSPAKTNSESPRLKYYPDETRASHRSSWRASSVLEQVLEASARCSYRRGADSSTEVRDGMW